MNVLIAVDVQRDFISGALAVPHAHDVILPLMDYMRTMDLVIATQDWHPHDHSSFDTNGGPWPEHCIAGTLGAKIDVHIDEGVDIVIRKGTDKDLDGYSAFERTALATLLEGLRHDDLHVYIAGLATDYCVLATALDSAKHGFPTTVLIDACQGVTPEGTRGAIEQMQDAGIRILHKNIAHELVAP
jgi:nicotinamidase/pyrazinamidase